MSTLKKRSGKEATGKVKKTLSESSVPANKDEKGKKVASKALTKGTKRTRISEKVSAPVKIAKVGSKNVKVSKKGAQSQSESEDDSREADEEEDPTGEDDETEARSTLAKAASDKVKEATKTAEASEESEDDEDDDGEMLHGLSDLSDVDSSDEDEADSIGEISKSGVVRLPSSRDDAAVKTKLDNVHKKRKESGKSTTPMVLYFGRVPKSMPEEPLRAYLTQFGDISRLRLSRNKHTGASKHYAFVEFKDEEVGKIVQETMNNYLLEGRLLQVRILPKDKVHPSLWVGADRKWRKVPETRRFRVKHDDTKTSQEKGKVQKKLLKRQEQRRQKIKSQGIDYDFVGYVAE